MSVPTSTPPRGYGSLVRDARFRALWCGSALTTGATSMAGLALGLVVHAETGSPFLTAVAVFGPSVAQFVGACTLMSSADTVSPRLVLAGGGAVLAVALAVQALVDLPPATRLVIAMGASVVLSLAAGARWGALADIVPAGGYALARSAMNISVGVMQVLGFAVGGATSLLLSPSGVFWIAAGCALVAGVVSWAGVGDGRARRHDRLGVRATWSGYAILFRRPSTRSLLVALTVPNGLIAGCEALFVSYAPESAAVLFMAGATGMLVGDVLVGRVLTPAARATATGMLRFLLAAPFAMLLWHPAVPIAALIVGAASLGYAATLGHQELLVRLVPAHLTGQILGAESAVRVIVQGSAAAIAGALAEIVAVDPAIAILSVCSLLVSALLTPHLRRARAQHPGDAVRPETTIRTMTLRSTP